MSSVFYLFTCGIQVLKHCLTTPLPQNWQKFLEFILSTCMFHLENRPFNKESKLILDLQKEIVRIVFKTVIQKNQPTIRLYSQVSQWLTAVIKTGLNLSCLTWNGQSEIWMKGCHVYKRLKEIMSVDNSHFGWKIKNIGK